MGRFRRHRSPLLAPLVAVVVVAAVVVAGLLTRSGDGLWGTGLFGALGRHNPGSSGPTASPSPSGSATPKPVTGPTPTAPAVLPQVAAGPASVSAAGRALLAAAATKARQGLGPSTGFAVLDAASGATLYADDAGRPRTPASTLKLLTATAALSALGPETRLATTVELAPDGTVVLVGGGDPTLTAAAPAGRGRAAAVDEPASLRALAAATATALRQLPPVASASASASTPTAVRVAVDDSLFSGPVASPAWPASYIGGGIVAPVSALMVDEARLAPPRPGAGGEYAESPRAKDPALAAGTRFAQLLASEGVRVDTAAVGRFVPPAGSRTLAAVPSPPVRSLVERMLTRSDNDIAESLLRLVGRATGNPASFVGGAAGVRSQLAALGVPVTGLVQHDGSGLSRDDRVAASTLAAALRAAASAAHPELRAVLTGLPIAGFTGTLAQRFSSSSLAGVVRAKTGTLTGVSTLAGTVVDHDGRQLVFAVLADRVAVTGSARAALDAFAAGVGRCGCVAR